MKATVADHIAPHKGDWMEFMTGELQSLCERCHNQDKARQERIGYLPDVAKDGSHIDPLHPSNAGARVSPKPANPEIALKPKLKIFV